MVENTLQFVQLARRSEWPPHNPDCIKHNQFIHISLEESSLHRREILRRYKAGNIIPPNIRLMMAFNDLESNSQDEDVGEGAASQENAEVNLFTCAL